MNTIFVKEKMTIFIVDMANETLYLKNSLWNFVELLPTFGQKYLSMPTFSIDNFMELHGTLPTFGLKSPLLQNKSGQKICHESSMKFHETREKYPF